MNIKELAQEATNLTFEIGKLEVDHTEVEMEIAKILGVDRASVINNETVFVNELLPGMVDGATVNFGKKKIKQHYMTVDGVEINYKEVIEE